MGRLASWYVSRTGIDYRGMVILIIVAGELTSEDLLES